MQISTLPAHTGARLARSSPSRPSSPSRSGNPWHARGVRPSCDRRSTPPAAPLHHAISLPHRRAPRRRAPAPASHGDAPEHVYTVRFTNEELWGPEAAEPNGVVYFDVWEPYIVPARTEEATA